MNIIELHSSPGSYRSGNATVTVVRKDFVKSNCFEKVVYAIKYDELAALRINSIKFLIFNYYSGTTDEFIYDIPNRPLESIDIYFSKFNRRNPLVVGFNSAYGQTTYFGYDELKNKKVSEIKMDSFSDGELFSLLIALDGIVNSKIRFICGNGIRKSVKTKIQVIGKFKRIVYTPDLTGGSTKHELYSENLFDRFKNLNSISDELLKKLICKEFNSIQVYYTFDRQVALMVDFVDDGVKYRFLRNDAASWDFDRVDSVESSDQVLNLLRDIYKVSSNLVYSAGFNSLYSNEFQVNGVRVSRLFSDHNDSSIFYGIIFGAMFFVGFILIFPIIVYRIRLCLLAMRNR